MTRASAPSLDPRAWLLWALAASLPPLLGRNPWPLAATLLAVIGVRAAWADLAGRGPWRGLVRLTLVILLLGVLFNGLTVHVGDRVLARLPDGWPLVGGPLTLNALLYGLLGGAATLALVLTGLTLGATLDWAALLRLLPDRMTGLAVAGAIGWGLVPQTITALREIREAQMARGYRPRGVRDVVPLLVPLLAGGLERAFLLAEALEARAFGAPLGAIRPPSRTRMAAGSAGLVAGLVGGYLLAVGAVAPALAGLLAAALGIGAALREPTADTPRRTRFREPRWGQTERLIALASGGALLVSVAVLALDPAAFAYEPYPTLTLPPVNLPLLAGLALLVAPALARP